MCIGQFSLHTQTQRLCPEVLEITYLGECWRVNVVERPEAQIRSHKLTEELGENNFNHFSFNLLPKVPHS